MGMNGLTTGVKNDIFWSNIRSGFVEPDGTSPRQEFPGGNISRATFTLINKRVS